MIMRAVGIAILSLLILGCNETEQVSVPKPVALTEEAAGHYCQMTVLDHPGPKAQVHLTAFAAPLFFTQVRDALAYQRMPEQASAISVIYVNDMGAASSWEQPGATNWVSAADAHYVVGSSRRGGMGAPELVPFRTKSAADAFVTEYGGTVIGYGEITDEMVLSPVEIELPAPSKPVARDNHDGRGGHDG